MGPKTISTKLAVLAAMILLCCGTMFSVVDEAQAQPPCNPCDFTITTATDWGGCSCSVDPCFSDPLQFCSNTTVYTVNCGPMMCNFVDSIVVTPPSGVCYSLCGASNTPTHQSWVTNHGSCDEGNGKMKPGVSPPPLGAGGSMIFKLCCSSTGNTFTMSVYSAGSTIPCNNHFSN